MYGAYKPTNFISVSYGIAEGAYSYFYINRQCQEYRKLGLQGVLVIYASQNSGVASGGCIHPDNANKTTLAANPGAFSPGWPAACPYVTSVGATKVSNILPSYGVHATKDCRSTLERLSESAASIPGSDFYSGGGLSNHWPAPDYQKASLDSYFTNTPPPYDNLTIYGTQYYNRTGREYPDVSAVGVNIPVYEAGKPVLEYGTSASVPSFASIINLINEHRIAAGRDPVGFLIPVLYQHPKAFTNVSIIYSLMTDNLANS
ncbi:hypothetical protein EIK77_001828 [Talaromyces pinophilus]|nr:hypothetical protein EIK77_001828 [Talaromyces pinophilus]